MDERFRREAGHIRALHADEAAARILKTYPRGSLESGVGIQLIACRTWPKEEQFQLARYYFQGMPFASSRPYKCFLKVMSVKNFLLVLLECFPEEKSNADLLMYHLEPLIEGRVNTDSEKQLWEKVCCGS